MPKSGDLNSGSLSDKIDTIFTSIVRNMLYRPTAFILWPATIFLILSYPALYGLYTSPLEAIGEQVIAARSVKSAFISESSSLSADFIIRRVCIQPSVSTDECNALNRTFLLDSLEIQRDLLVGLERASEFVDHAGVILHTPLDLWDSDPLLLAKDSNVLKTIQRKSVNQELFLGLSKTDGLVRSASAIWLVFAYQRSYADEVEPIWRANIARIGELDKFKDRFTVVDDASSATTLSLKFSLCHVVERFALSFLSWALIVYSAVAFTNLGNLKSKPGLLFAFCVEMFLAVFAAASITSFRSGKSSDLLGLPIPILLCIPVFLGTENTFRLVSAVARTSDEWSVPARVHKAVLESTPVSVSSVIAVCLTILSVIPFTGSSTSLDLCVFILFCCFFDLILHVTFFTAVLTVDVRRLELEDLLQRERGSEELSSPSIEVSLSEWRKFVTAFTHRLRLPLFTSVHQTILAVIVMIVWVLSWTRSTASKDTLSLATAGLGFTANIRQFASDVSKAMGGKSHGTVYFDVTQPSITYIGSKVTHTSINTLATFRFDVSYFIEFASFVTFIASAAYLTLKVTVGTEKKAIELGDMEVWNRTANQPEAVTIKAVAMRSRDASIRSSVLSSETFKAKELSRGHFLDVMQVTTSSCPFVVSVGMDHKILVWSPLTVPIPVPTQLPVSGRFLPVTNVVMSSSGSLIAVFSKCGVVKCWSRLSMSWIWTIHAAALENDQPLEAFFRQRHSPGMRSRRGPKRKGTHKHAKHRHSRMTELEEKENYKPKAVEEEDIFPEDDDRSRAILMRRNDSSTTSTGGIRMFAVTTRSLSMDSKFDSSTNINRLSANTHKDFVIVLKSGTMLTIDCTDGSIERESIFDNLINTKKGSPPFAEVLTCKKLFSPRINDRIVFAMSDGSLVVSTAVGTKWRSRRVEVKGGYNGGKSGDTRLGLPETGRLFNEVSKGVSEFPSPVVLTTVPFVGMVVRAFDLTAQLIDAQSGTLLKEWPIGQFKPGSFKVFHPEPSHCRFCGCASVSSFSVAYTELESDTLILHTFSIDNRAKNNICLRVERDPRETRCLGFASVTEHQHWLTGVEGWCSTDLNAVMGVRRKDRSLPTTDEIGIWERCYGLVEQEAGVLRRRATKGKKSGLLSETHISSVSIDSTVSSTISSTWEGFNMNADGCVNTYEIPEGDQPGLLMKRLGPVRKFGHKSIVATFGNIMKVLYLGNDNLIEESDGESAATVNSFGQTSNSLSFINRRRRMRLRKYRLTHSTNFNDSVPASAVTSDVD
ncbi:DEKNAAC101036 [Brettanomyces naardenensis]|uniref:Sterol regulatory element-binding protein cleavage-activating protein n=1 Tax=Brettanomyces naardenensis TaxID=13370 RepID=A0A448YGY0_BRENA|nr:DEKNAAC101036 [Brettanomyces naardenensis]